MSAKIFDGVHVRLTLERAAPGVVLVKLSGYDVGELGDAPLKALEKEIETPGLIELYVDARATKGASIEVSNQWALWLARNRSRFKSIRMAAGSRYVEMTAEFVRRFAELDDIMIVDTDPAVFDAALERSIRGGSQ